MVFMMDSWWNPSVEYQAMDRIHRLGQKRPVKVVKLVVEDSIEDQVGHRDISDLHYPDFYAFLFPPTRVIASLAVSFHCAFVLIFRSFNYNTRS